MATYLIQKAVEESRGVARERFEVTADGAYVTAVDLPRETTDAYHAAVLMLRARVLGRIGDRAPVFAAKADEPECVAIAGMLNA